MLDSVAYKAFLNGMEEKVAFINPISAIKPITGNLARTAYGGAKNLLKDSWKGLSGVDKTLTIGLPLATTVPGMFNKKDPQGASRAERVTSLTGNVAGGTVGTHLGNQLAKKITTKLPGTTGKILGTAASVIGGVGGSLAGESAAKAPFKALGSNNNSSYALQPPPMPPAPPMS